VQSVKIRSAEKQTTTGRADDRKERREEKQSTKRNTLIVSVSFPPFVSQKTDALAS